VIHGNVHDYSVNRQHKVDKYDLLTSEMVQYLTANTDGTFSEISKSIFQSLNDRKIILNGSLNWYLEWVKLDLEARQVITRVPKTSPQKYILTKN